MKEFKCDRGCGRKFTHQESLDVHYRDGCNFKDIIKSKDKEIKDLKEQALTWGEHARESQKAAREIEKERDELKKQLATTRSNYLFQISEQDAEIERLNERLARMGEYVGSVQQELIAVDNPVCDQQPLIDDLENALSSYDPKWIEGVRVKAQEEIVDYLTLKFAENGPVGMAHDIRKLWENLKAVRQPNQSQEKRG